jgi:hypothetical protein
MYPYGVSHLACGRAANHKFGACVVMIAGGWLALTVTPAVSAQDAAASDKAVVEVRDKGKDTVETGAADRERKESPEAAKLAAAEGDAPIVEIKPGEAENRQVCRKIAVTGTRFTRRECRTLEEWEEMNTAKSAEARRLVRDVQRQSSSVPSLEPGQDTPNGRPSGLPSPSGF